MAKLLDARSLKCSMARLSIPDILVNVSEIVYLDADTRVVGPIASLFVEPLQARVFAMADNLGCDQGFPSCAYNKQECLKRGNIFYLLIY